MVFYCWCLVFQIDEHVLKSFISNLYSKLLNHYKIYPEDPDSIFADLPILTILVIKTCFFKAVMKYLLY